MTLSKVAKGACERELDLAYAVDLEKEPCGRMPLEQGGFEHTLKMQRAF